VLKTYDVWENAALSKRAATLGEAADVRYFWFAQVTSEYRFHLDLKLVRTFVEPNPSWIHLIATDVEDALKLIDSDGIQEARMTLQTPFREGKGYIFSEVVNIKEAYDANDRRVMICRCENACSYILDPESFDETQLSRKKQIWP
jgi:hypothetical protein